MSRFLKTLSAIGLVELSSEEKQRLGAKTDNKPSAAPSSSEDIDALLAETRQLLGNSEPAPTTPLPPPPPPAPPPPQAPRAEGSQGHTIEARPFADLYAEQSVPSSPFPAEKLVRMMDGLMAMPEPMRKAAVLAMDAADDDWSIEDPLLDAQRKVRALEAARAAIATQLSAAEASTQASLAEQDRYEQEATTTIRQQIAEMEALLQAELAKAADVRAEARAALHAAQEAAARETTRFDQEILRLRRLAELFSSDPNPSKG